MGIMKPRNRGEHQKYLSCHHLVILHHTFTDPNLNGSFDPFAALEPRLFTQGFGDPLAHLLCKRSWDVRETSNKQQWIWRWKRFACFFFNPQPCAWAVSLWDFSSIVILFHIFSNHAYYWSFLGHSSWPLPFDQQISPTFSPSCKAIFGSLDWTQSSPRFFGWKMRDIRVANLSRI